LTNSRVKTILLRLTGTTLEARFCAATNGPPLLLQQQLNTSNDQDASKSPFTARVVVVGAVLAGRRVGWLVHTACLMLCCRSALHATEYSLSLSVNPRMQATA
jgi:hypothetical protein